MANSSRGSPLDRMFDALSHPARRWILTVLERGQPRDTFTVRAFEAERSRLRPIELHHNHLPKLDDAGYVDWDSETGTVRRGPRFEEIAPLVRLLQHHREKLPVDWP